MTLKYRPSEDEFDALPEAHQALYEGDPEKGWELQVDLTGSPIKSALEDERSKAKDYLARLKTAGINPDDDGKSDREKALEAENAKLREAAEAEELRKRDDTIRRAIETGARSAAALETALPDIVEVTSKGFTIDEAGEVVTSNAEGAPDGLKPHEYLTHVRQSKRHWFKPSKGGGAGGLDHVLYTTPKPEANPFRSTTFSIGAQMELEQRDPIKASELRRQAFRIR